MHAASTIAKLSRDAYAFQHNEPGSIFRVANIFRTGTEPTKLAFALAMHKVRSFSQIPRHR
jgi:hypothetical protein